MRHVLVEVIAVCAICGEVAQAADLLEPETQEEADGLGIGISDYVCYECGECGEEE